MSNPEIIRAWKDADYRMGLSVDELALLPTNPAGDIDLIDERRRSARQDSTVWRDCTLESVVCCGTNDPIFCGMTD